MAQLTATNVPLVAIVGPTASGKTSLAITLARQLNGELISADSWAVRREINIGTAKPTPDELGGVKCHMVDVVAPCQDFSAAVYKKEAELVLEDVAKRGRLPILVGGSGLYVDAVLYDYSFLPKAARSIRNTLNNMSLKELQLRATSLKLPLDQIDMRNKRRIIRLIETGGAMPVRHNLRENTLIIGLDIPNDTLKQAIKDRVKAMIATGLEEEVRHLVSVYGWDCEGLKGIGYHEWKLYFEHHQSLDQTYERIIKDSMELAKRQKTWFKRNRDIYWVTTPVNHAKIVDLITTKFA